MELFHGASLPDPKGVLQGAGKQTRFIRLPSVDVLQRPEVKALVTAQVARATPPFPKTGRGTLVIRSETGEAATAAGRGSQAHRGSCRSHVEVPRMTTITQSGALDQLIRLVPSAWNRPPSAAGAA